jgi:GAF domain-containing protein
MNGQAASDWDSERIPIHEIERRRTTFLDRLLLTAAVGGMVALILTYISRPADMSMLERLTESAPFLAIWLVALVAWTWRGMGYRTRALIVVLIAYIMSVYTLRRVGLPGSGRVWLLIVPALAFLLMGLRSGMVAGVLSLLTYAVFAVAFSRGGLVPLLVESPFALRAWVNQGASFLLVAAGLMTILWSSSRAWLQALERASETNTQLRDHARELAETNERLYQQTRELQAVAEVAYAGSSILNPEKLLTEVVDRIQEGFSYMGVNTVRLYLLDESDSVSPKEQFAVLSAVAGGGGGGSESEESERDSMPAVECKLAVDEMSPIGQCIIHRQARVSQSADRNPPLEQIGADWSPEEAAADLSPDIFGEGQPGAEALLESHKRADRNPPWGQIGADRNPTEVALPLRSRGRILGALSVQGSQDVAFGEADVAVLQTMADHVAVAIDNARLFSQTETALEEVRAVQRRYLTQAWREFLAARPTVRADYVSGSSAPSEESEEDWLREARREAMVRGRAVAVGDSLFTESGGEDARSESVLVVPLKLRGQVIGTVALHREHDQQPWTAEEIALAEAVAEQSALTVENLRLVDEMRRRATRERLISEIADHMQRATDMESLMHIAADGLNRALSSSRAFVRMGVGDGEP